MCLSRVIHRTLTASCTCTISSTKTVIYFNAYITPQTIFSSPSLLFPWEWRVHRERLGPRVFSRSKTTEWLAPEPSLAFPQPGGFVKWSFPLRRVQASLGLCSTTALVFPSIQACAVKDRLSLQYLDNVLVTCSVLVPVIGLLFWREGFRISNTHKTVIQICKKFNFKLPPWSN